MPEEVTEYCWLCPTIAKIIKWFKGDEEETKEPE